MKHAQRQAARKKYGRLEIVMSEHNTPMMVGRPQHPQAVLAAAKAAAASGAPNLDAAIAAGGEHRMVGFLAKPVARRPDDPGNLPTYVVDEHGEILDETHPGDSFFATQFVASISKEWTPRERLAIAAACAQAVIQHLASGGQYAAIGTPTMETIRNIVSSPVEELETFRAQIEAMVNEHPPSDDVYFTDEQKRLDDVAACATFARDSFMASRVYGAPGRPTMETILLIASGSDDDVAAARAEIDEYVRRAKLDRRTGQQALTDTVDALAATRAANGAPMN
ncbi:MAG: hypothetical protein ACHREM_04645 [Polyangiales bacterium]